jgi:hypothetical protein
MRENQRPSFGAFAVALAVELIVAGAVAGCGSSPQSKSPTTGGAGSGSAGASASGTSGASGTSDTSGSSGASGSTPTGGNAGSVTTTGAAGDSAGTAGGGAAGSGASGSGAGGDATGTAGAGGALGTAGSGAAGTGAAAGASGAGLTTKDFACTELIGLWVASQWWGSFEAGVENAKWEFMFQHHGYLELFADPASPFWMNAVTSQCTMMPKTPDRVVFLPFSLSLRTMDDWVTNLTKVIETMKGKFPGVKRIELMTTLRSPGNVPCAGNTDPDIVVAPYVDAAIQQVADASGGLVTVGPKIEVGSCSWWAGNSHDLTGAGNTGAGQLLAQYYQTH